MRLLSLSDDDCFSLKWFPEDNIPPYAIPSHTWFRGEKEEVTFKEVQEGIRDNRPGFQKLKFCGEQAKTDRLSYFWVDTCCIDKSNETELTTAINTMFWWYQNAVKCYVYLSDVGHISWESDFPKSAWFTRGWTLQELLAPNDVEFYSQDRVWLGSKKSLEQQIANVTGIAVGALQGQILSDFSIMDRFRWVSLV